MNSVIPAQGMISGDLQQYVQRLSELICNLPDTDIREARRMLQGIFDCCDRLEGLESTAVIGMSRSMPHITDGVRRCRICGCTDDNACAGGCWWVAEDLCSACADIGSAQ